MKSIKIILFMVCLIVLFVFCKNKDNSIDIILGTYTQNNYKSEIENTINDIIEELGYINYEIKIYPKEIYDYINNGIFWEGSDEPILELSLKNDNNEIYKDMSNLFGLTTHITIDEIYKNEYENEKINKYDSFTIIIIFEKLNKVEKDELWKKLKYYLGNIEYDTISIFSRNEYSNNFE
jgi:ABC-type Fe3+-citrate transport system substrate-binding protein